jgi:DNA-binding GntR family transcriptional regulator
MQAERLPRTNLVSAARSAIKRLIVTGQLSPGTPLKIEELATRLGVSSSPIREALRLLQSDGLVEIVPFCGATVRAFGHAELAEVYEIREFLETGALRKAAPDFPPDCIKKLEAAWAEMQKAMAVGDQAAFLAADIAFHQGIVDMASNKQLSELYSTLAERGMCFMLGRDAALFNQCRQEHSGLLKAIRSHEAKKALRLLEEHFRDTVKAVQRLRVVNSETPGEPGRVVAGP